MDSPTFLSITPYLRYPDGDAAADWLSRVFGFGPARSVRDEDGRWSEGEIAIGPVRIDINGGAGPQPGNGSGALLIVGVSDVDALRARVVAAGVDMTAPQDESYGPRSCHVTDPWGYQWYFWQGDSVYPAT